MREGIIGVPLGGGYFRTYEKPRETQKNIIDSK